MAVADHERDPSQAALDCFAEASDDERANDVTPKRLAFAVADLEAEQFPAPIDIHAHGDVNRSGAELHRPALTAMEVGGIEEEVGVATGLQRPAEERLHLQSMSAQIRLTWDFEIPLWLPRAATRAST